MQAVVEEYLDLAESVAYSVYRKAPHAMELDETKAQALLGLVKAADRWMDYCAERGYDPDHMQYFAVFATRRIRGGIIDALRKKDFATRAQRDSSKQLFKAGLGSGASEEELAERTGMSPAEIRETVTAVSAKPVSLEAVGELSIPDRTLVEQAQEENAVLEGMVSFMRELPYDEQVVLALHYYMNMELREIAKLLQITESKASHLHTSAVMAVRNLLSTLVAPEDSDGNL